MKTNEISKILIVVILLTPNFMAKEQNGIEQSIITTNYLEANVGIKAGDIIYYNIEQLILADWMEPELVTLPDFAGNQIFLKILDIYNNYQYAPLEFGNIIYAALGILFDEDELFVFGDEPFTLDIIIPFGASTPSQVLYGAPHFDSHSISTMLFALNNDWVNHENILNAKGINVNQNSETFEINIVNNTGELSSTWRKVDGILTHLFIDDIVFQNMNFTDATIELSFEKKDYRPLPINPGDSVDFIADTFDLELSGTGYPYTSVNLSSFNSIISKYESAQGKKIIKVVVDDIEGVYYHCSIFVYNFETGKMEKNNDHVIFNGFLGAIQNPPAPFILESNEYIYIPYFAPFITPDWDIYQGFMKLLNTILGEYNEEILNFIGYLSLDFIFNSLVGGFNLIHKKDFYFFKVSLDLDFEENFTLTSLNTFFPQGYFEKGINTKVNFEGYLCYTLSGIPAAIRVVTTYTMEYYEELPLTTLGEITLRIDIKLRNLNYNPPEIIKISFLHGFNWIILMPSLIMIITIILIKQKRKLLKN